jgi:hypothetical protein
MKRSRRLAALVGVAGIVGILVGMRMRPADLPHPAFLGSAAPFAVQDLSSAYSDGPYVKVYALRQPYTEVLKVAQEDLKDWKPVIPDPKKRDWQACWERTTADGRVEKITVADMRRFDAHYGKKTVPADGLPMVNVLISRDERPWGFFQRKLRQGADMFKPTPSEH